ncbi:PAS domain S-box protein [Limibacter armeniacum]|uniref:PAS domain S-box protein n=1 Tax=Limibacter armeniacum TaxID=466084 RepID=UPI002FE50206
MLRKDNTSNLLKKLGKYVSLETIMGRTVLLTLFFLIILGSFTGLVLIQNSEVKKIGERVVNISNPITYEISRISAGIEQSSSVMRGYFLTHSGELKDERNALWDLTVFTSLKKLEQLAVMLTPEERRSIDALGVLLKEYKHAQDDLELYFEQRYNQAESGDITATAQNGFLTESMRGQEETRKYIEESIVNTLRPLKIEIQELLQPLSKTQSNALEEDISHIHVDIAKANSTIGLITILFAIMAIASTLVVIRILGLSIRKPVELLQVLATGNISEVDISYTKDELNDVIVAGNQVKENLKSASEFAARIGNGEFVMDFHPASETDVLGNALIQMRDKLQAIAKEDEKRNWSTKGVAHFGEILRDYNTGTKSLSEHLISELVEFVEANQGAIYILNETKEESQYLELMAAYAYNKRRVLNKQVFLESGYGEGLIGQVFITGETIYMNNVPDGYTEITSGLGEATPKSILIVPLRMNESSEGVIELASFKDFEEHEIAFVERLSESITSTLRAVRTAERTKLLLEESQLQSERMRAQEEEMRQNMEELAATQEEMDRKQQELQVLKSDLEIEVQNRTEELNNALERFNLALEGTTEGLWDTVLPQDGVITDDTKFWWSPKFKTLLGYNDNEFAHEFRSLKENIHPDDREQIVEMMMKHLGDTAGKVMLDMEVRLRMKNGSYNWFRAVGTTQRNEYGLPVRFAGAISDISAKKLLEKNQQVLRGREAQFNALMDNTADMILGVNKDFKIIMANAPQKKHYKTLGVQIKEGISTLWQLLPETDHEHFRKILNRVLAGGRHTETISNKDHRGNFKHYEYNFTPIITEEHETLGIAIVTKDITEIKQKQLDAEQSQKQLQSILDNYKAEVYLKDTHGKYIMADYTFCQAVGKENYEIIGKIDSELFPEQMAQDIWASDKQVLESRQASHFEYRGRSGKIYSFTKFPLFNRKGKVYSICSIGMDVTEYKQIEVSFRNKEIIFERMLANVPGVISEFHYKRLQNEYGFSYLSGYVANLLGETPQKLTGIFRQEDSPIQFESQEDFSKLISELEKGESVVWSGLMKAAVGGGFIMVTWNGRVTEKDDEQITWNGLLTAATTYSDESVILQLQKSLNKKEEQLASLASQPYDIKQSEELPIWLSHLPGVVCLRSTTDVQVQTIIAGNIEELTGYNVADFNHAELKLKDLIPATGQSSYAMALKEIEKALEHRTNYTVKYPITDKNGQTRLILEKGKVITGLDGKQEIEGYLTDITNLRPQRKRNLN